MTVALLSNSEAMMVTCTTQCPIRAGISIIIYVISVFVSSLSHIKVLPQLYQDEKVCAPSLSVVQVSNTNERDNQCAVWLI